MLFRAVSRLGDGVFWYALMFLLLAADGTAAIALWQRQNLFALD